MLNRASKNDIILIANVRSSSVSFIDANSLQLMGEVPVGRKPHEVVVSPDGNTALVSNFGDIYGFKYGSTLTVLDVPNMKVKDLINLEKGSRPHGIAFIDNDHALVTAQGINALLHINISSNEVLHQIRLPNQGAHMVVLDDKKEFAYVANTEKGSVTKIELSSMSITNNLQFGKEAQGMALTQDGRLLVTNRIDHKLHILNVNQMSQIGYIKTDRGPVRVSLLNDDKRAVVTNTISGTAQIFDINTQELLHRFNTSTYCSKNNGKFFGKLLPVPISTVVCKENNTAFITNFFAGNISKVDLDAGVILNTFEAAKGPDGMDISHRMTP